MVIYVTVARGTEGGEYRILPGCLASSSTVARGTEGGECWILSSSTSITTSLFSDGSISMTYKNLHNYIKSHFFFM